MKKVLLTLIVFFAMAAVAYADQKPTAPELDAVKVSATGDDHADKQGDKKDHGDKRRDKKERAQKHERYDHDANDSGSDHDKMDAKDGAEEHHGHKHEKKNHKHD